MWTVSVCTLCHYQFKWHQWKKQNWTWFSKTMTKLNMQKIGNKIVFKPSSYYYILLQVILISLCVNVILTYTYYLLLMWFEILLKI